MVISKKSIIFQGFRGSNIFQGGGGGDPTFSRGGGPSANFYKNPYNLCDFTGEGVQNPYPPSGSAHDCL